jgi:hypothetical protein
MNEREPSGLERPPRIVALALQRRYPRYSRDRVFLPKEFFWYGDSVIDVGQTVLMRATIDTSKDKIRNAIEEIELGVVSKDDASSMWLTIPNPSTFLYPQAENRSLNHSHIIDDTYTTAIVSHYKELTPEHGRLVSEKIQLGRLAEFLVTKALTESSGIMEDEAVLVAGR